MIKHVRESVVEELWKLLENPLKPTQVQLGNPNGPWRRVNHFLVGTDPEFYFQDQKRNPIYPDVFGLRTGLAYGADNNGRLVEVRPAPSRSILELVAATRVCLGLLHTVVPETRGLVWRANAWTGNDGVGGHIHFGRVFEKPEVLVAKLDSLSILLDRLKLSDANWERRTARKAQGFGKQGDFRPQLYGFEYRTLPTWLGSMRLAFVVMTLAKLVVYVPSAWMIAALKIDDVHQQAEILWGMLAGFSNLDDDAALACEIVRKHGWPVFTEAMDFRPEWGIPVLEASQPADPKGGVFAPNKNGVASKADVCMAFRWLLEQNPPMWGLPEPSTQGSTLLKNYMLLNQDVPHAARWVELVGGLCCHEQLRVRVEPNGNLTTDHPIALHITGRLMCCGVDEARSRIASALKVPVSTVHLTMETRPQRLRIGVDFDMLNRKELVEAALTCGVFPIWRTAEVKAESFIEWSRKMLVYTLQVKDLQGPAIPKQMGRVLLTTILQREQEKPNVKREPFWDTFRTPGVIPAQPRRQAPPPNNIPLRGIAGMMQTEEEAAFIRRPWDPGEDMAQVAVDPHVGEDEHDRGT